MVPFRVQLINNKVAFGEATCILSKDSQLNVPVHVPVWSEKDNWVQSEKSKALKGAMYKIIWLLDVVVQHCMYTKTKQLPACAQQPLVSCKPQDVTCNFFLYYFVFLKITIQATILYIYIIISNRLCPFAAICCLLTWCQGRERDSISEGRKKDKVCTASPASKHKAGKQHTQMTCDVHYFCT